jgi:hypothetical protein
VNVTVPAGYSFGESVPEARVELRKDELLPREQDLWDVYLGERKIGYVWKGHRTYSPPTHKGSRIVRYHRQVPEWQGSPDSRYSPRIRKDTRVEVLRELLRRA